MSSKTYRGWFAGLSDSRLVGLASASLVASHRSSSPRIKYQQQYHTDMYRPLSESTMPILKRDTDPYRFCLSTKLTDMPTLPPPPPVTIAAAFVAPPIAGIRRAWLASGVSWGNVAVNHTSWGPHLCFFRGFGAGRGGGGGSWVCDEYREARSSSRAVRLRVLYTVPLPFARDHGRDNGVGCEYTACIPCPCAPAPPHFVSPVRLYVLGTFGHSCCR